MADNDLYRQYIDYVSVNAKKIFILATKDINDAIKIKEDKSYLSLDFLIEGTRCHACVNKEIQKKLFQFTICPCGTYGQSDDMNTHEDDNNKKLLGIRCNHIVTCLPLAKKIDEIGENKSILATLLGYHKTRKRPNKGILALLNKYEKVTPIKRSVSKSHNTYAHQINIDESLGNSFLLSSAIVQTPRDFPSLPGIYFIRYFSGGGWQPLYIGRSVNLKTRWYQHHRQNEVEFLQKLDIPIEFRYIAETPLLKFSESLESIESKLIKEFNPRLNWEGVSNISASGIA